MKATSIAGQGVLGTNVEAVNQWRFDPALRNSEPLSVYFTVIVTFRPGKVEEGVGPVSRHD